MAVVDVVASSTAVFGAESLTCRCSTRTARPGKSPAVRLAAGSVGSADGLRRDPCCLLRPLRRPPRGGRWRRPTRSWRHRAWRPCTMTPSRRMRGRFPGPAPTCRRRSSGTRCWRPVRRSCRAPTAWCWRCAPADLKQVPTIFLIDPGGVVPRVVPLASLQVAKGTLLGGVYAYLDNENRVVMIDGNNHLLRVSSCPGRCAGQLEADRHRVHRRVQRDPGRRRLGRPGARLCRQRLVRHRQRRGGGGQAGRRRDQPAAARR